MELIKDEQTIIWKISSAKRVKKHRWAIDWLRTGWLFKEGQRTHRFDMYYRTYSKTIELRDKVSKANKDGFKTIEDCHIYAMTIIRKELALEYLKSINKEPKKYPPDIKPVLKKKKTPITPVVIPKVGSEVTSYCMPESPQDGKTINVDGPAYFRKPDPGKTIILHPREEVKKSDIQIEAPGSNIEIEHTETQVNIAIKELIREFPIIYVYSSDKTSKSNMG